MSRKRKNGIIAALLALLIAAAGYYFYKKLFGAAARLNKNYAIVYIETGSALPQVVSVLAGEQIVKDEKSFLWLAGQMDLSKNIHPGRYRILNGMSYRQIINLIKYGKDEKIKLSYNSQIRDIDDFVRYTAEKLEMNESEIEEYLSDEKKLSDQFGLDPDNCFALVVPGVYEVSWAIKTDSLFSLLSKAYWNVWTKERREKLKRTGLSIPELITLASIVQGESSIKSEQEKIAGVYMNRLNRNMLLQADPTLRFANKKYNDVRFYDSDKETNSPYNTYKFKGLPPGPVSLVSRQAIDATLNYQKHKYLFFCAKCELNGYSDFSETYEQHKKFAEAYQKAMDRKGIR